MLIKNKNIQIDVIVQESGYILSDMDGETVILGIDNGKYYNLGHIGGFIWSGVHSPIAEQEQAHSFLEKLMDEGLIRKQ